MTEHVDAGTLPPGPGAPTPPIEIAGGAAAATSRLQAQFVPVDDALLGRLRGACAQVTDDPAVVGETSRDWWPLAMTWATAGQVAARAAVVARPKDPDEVAAVVRLCHEAGVPVTAAAGRSGVLGGSVPVHGGVVLDLCDLVGIRSVDDTSLTVDVLAGTFGDRFEAELRETYGLTCGHWPQSMTLSTVGGWAACRGAGQLSTRYGKIEDIVVGLDVVLADGTQITTGGAPRQAAGPDLTQVFVGSEGTLGIITGVRLRVHPVPTYERRGAWAFSSVADGLDACRRILRRGGTPAVLRLYDGTESDRNYHVGTDKVVVLALDEGDPAVVDGCFAVVEDVMSGSERLDDSLVDHWLAKRNDVAALEALIKMGAVVDTMEVSGPWADLPGAYDAVVAAMSAVPGVIAASAHCSHSYLTGGCLYFTFGGRPAADGDDAPTVEQREALHRAVWEAGQRAALAAGMSVSHHHGVGLHRGQYLPDALGGGFAVLQALKSALDPTGILNPGKLGLDSPFGPVVVP